MRRLTTKEFIINSKKVHGDKYNYSNSEYINSRTKITIDCPIHGTFDQLANSHMQGEGCPKCGKLINKNTLTSLEFIERSKLVHFNKYSYEKTIYKNAKQKVIITCLIHGDFEQLPFHHLNGHGCKLCSKSGAKYSTNDFIIRAKEVHKDLYDYSKVVYINKDEPIIIICKDHGEFLQTPHNHINGCGCQKCKITKTQNKIFRNISEKFCNEFIESESSPIWLLKQRFDIYFPDYNIAIEYNGEQHYFPVSIFGGEKGFIKTQERDQRKRQKCIDNNCILFELRYNYSENDYKEVVESINEFINKFKETKNES